MPWQSVLQKKRHIMPELPEVEVVKRGLEPHLTGRIITSTWHNGKKLRVDVPCHEMQRHLPGTTIACLKRRAKFLILELGNDMLLIIHLGMTGKLGLFKPSSPLMVHDHVSWMLDNGMELRFNDVRRFGSISLIQAGQRPSLEDTFFKTTGPEPFDDAFNAAYLRRKAAGRSVPVKNFIMTNKIVAGIGNIYANESLFAAGIRPTRPAGKIGLKKWTELIEKIREVLSRAILCGGSTISDFISASGEKGYFQINFCVYGRGDERCPNCTAQIKTIRLGGRASFFCPRCQR